MKLRPLRLLGWLPLAAVALAATGELGGLRWRRYEAPEFPQELVRTGVRAGSATLLFTFDDDGRLTDRLVLTASHPAFSASVLEASSAWEIDTAGLRASLRRESLRFEFERRGAVITMSQRDAAKAAFTPYGDAAAVALATCGEEELDAPLRATAQALPAFPPELPAAIIEGTATISFVVDGAGRARVAVASQASAPEFGVAALAAVRGWNYAPARRDGRIVQVMVERTLRFRRAAAVP